MGSGRFSLKVMALADVSSSCSAMAYMSAGWSPFDSHKCNGLSLYGLLFTFQVPQYTLKNNLKKINKKHC